MSGYVMQLLFEHEGDPWLQPIPEAEAFIDRLYDRGDLDPGQLGHVSKTEPMLHAKDDVNAFVKLVRALNGERTSLARTLIREAQLEARVPLDTVKPDEAYPDEPNRLVGWRVQTAGSILSRAWTPQAILYDVAKEEAGLTEPRIAEIRAKPDLFYLVQVVVG